MHSAKEHCKRILDLLPVGYLMKDKHDDTTNQYKFWLAIAAYYVILEEDFRQLIRELGIETTEYLIERWEAEFGLPDSVIDIATTLEERRANVLLKKAGLNLLNIDDFRSIATRIGYNSVVITPSTVLRYPPYNVPFFPMGSPGDKFLVVIKGDFSIINIQYLADFFEILLPINVGMLLLDTSLM
jgi:hypothetical protein